MPTSGDQSAGRRNPDDRKPNANVDSTSIMRIKNLQLRAKMIVHGFYNGLHRSPIHGSSVEFSEYRPYSVGDDLRGLDWKRYARSDRYFIKKFEDETNRRCYLVVDQSKSMGYGSLEYTKIEYARTIAATIAHFLMLQRDNVGLLTFDEEIGDYISAQTRVGHFHHLLVALSRPLQGKGTDIDAPLRQIAGLIRRRGLVILISDLLTSIQTLQTNLAYLRSRGHEVVILRVLDPAEFDFQIDKPSMVLDVESGREIYIDPDAARQDYQTKFNEHRQQLGDVCDSLGVDHYEISTDDSMDDALFHIVDAQSRRGKSTARGGMLVGAAKAAGGQP
ncbi:DUF58 domain-containing protein [Planctomycetes bacterium K23_9]|uniref:VWA domain containing CoxE-like protein n=1 Tax=Stieleria marina TaxID=1930275 RepID=A0A517NYN9_9BACT|nr:VWA domain containing CoxE-like protein [Planctomycetes bacterium K23_9]